jgi:hypothetical protein
MATAQIDRSVTDMIRSASLVYVETAIPAGMTVSDYRRSRPAARRSILRRMTSRYPDDRVGDYETTDGGW